MRCPSIPCIDLSLLKRMRQTPPFPAAHTDLSAQQSPLMALPYHPSAAQISLLKRMGQPCGNGGFASAGDIQATVEEEAVEQQGGAGRSVFFIRFYEGPASLVDRRCVLHPGLHRWVDLI